MAKKMDDSPKVSSSNTKKEMLETIKDLKKKLEEKAEMELKPEKKVEQKKIQEIVTVVDSLSMDSIEKDISSLKLDAGKMLTQISEKLAEEINKYKKTQEAIDIKNKELEEIFEIEKSAFALAALIEAQTEKKRAFEIEMERIKKELDDEIQRTRLEWEKEKKEYAEFVKERDAEEKKKRDREKEEYLYGFQREKQLTENKVKDEIKKLEKELTIKQEEFDKKITEQEKKLKEREDAIKGKEQELEKLQREAESFPKKLETAVNKAITETAVKLKEDAGKDIALLKKGDEGEKNVFKIKIESLEKLVADQNKQITNLSEKLEKAYGKVQDIAVKAVEGSANIKLLSSLRQSGEKNSKSSQE
ncbi:MAG: hypothetical protein L6416_08350 [Candidatus Omnitrophica bacterium]|nr:hypothetical protein [Candidatus Omnitrophota bacterium]